MKSTLAVLNRLENKGFIERYAIAGAIGALFYMDPFETEDLDVLILLPAQIAQSLARLSTIYEELHRLGYNEDGPYINIEGVPVQFLVAYNPLTEEAVREACDVPYEDVATRVPTPEHLAAIMLDTGRDKDRLRFGQLCDQVALDADRLRELTQRYNLMERFREWTSD